MLITKDKAGHADFCLEGGKCCGDITKRHMPVMKAPTEERMLSGEPTLSMGVGLFTPSLLSGATINCTGSLLVTLSTISGRITMPGGLRNPLIHYRCSRGLRLRHQYLLIESFLPPRSILKYSQQFW